MNLRLFVLSATIAGGAQLGTVVTALPTSKAPHLITYAPKPYETLYGQMTRDSGVAVSSFQIDDGDYDSYSNQGADDFVVPKGQRWVVRKVVTPGVYFGGEGTDGVNVFIYKNDRYMPGDLKAQVLKAPFIDRNGFFVIDVGKLHLRSGRYWLSVQEICDFVDGQAQWAWETTTRQSGNPAVWRNPGGGYGICPAWNTLANCFDGGNQGPDFMFALKGISFADTGAQ